MRKFKGIPVFILVVGAATAAETPPAPTAAPAPTAPAASASFPAFDAGTRVAYYAEPNYFRAYLTNPADLNLIPRTFVGGDVGGDLSFGGFDLRLNDGSAGAGPTAPGERSGLDISYLTGLGGQGLGAYRAPTWVVGGQARLDRSQLKFSYNGRGILADPLLATDDGWTDLDVIGFNYGGTVAGAYAIAPHVLGGSFAYRAEKEDGSYDFEYLPDTGEGAGGTHAVKEQWGRREVKDYWVKVGYSFAPGGNYDLGGAVGYRAFHSTLDGRASASKGETADSQDEGSAGHVAADSPAITVDVAGRYLFGGRIRLGGAFGMQRLNSITVDYTGESWDMNGPFGEHEYQDFRLADGNELRIRTGGGVAFYPDDRTTLALDYTYDRLSIQGDVYSSNGEHDYDVAAGAYHTFTQLGLERWLIDNLAVRGGWRQNLFTLPRTVFNAGVSYKITDQWFFNYDYNDAQLSLDTLSLFVPFDEIVQPASHRIMVVRYF